MEGGSGSWVVSTNGTCKAVAFLNVCALYMSAFAIISITGDRYCAVIWPFTTLNAIGRTKVVAISVWILGIICSLPEVRKFD